MHNEQFVYLLPRTDVTARKKNILIIEKHPGIPVVMTEAHSIKQAVGIIDRVRKETPRSDIIVDTGAPAGRDILLRTQNLLRFNEKDYDPRYYLSQLFLMLKHRIPEAPYIEQREFIDEVVGMLFSARSLGGRRPCTKADALIAEIGLGREPPIPTDQRFEGAFLHPLCLVPRFFVSESSRILGKRTPLLGNKEMTEMVRLAFRIATIRQSPFPDSPYPWLFPDREAAAGLRSRTDDFIYAALGGTTRTRKKLHENHPAQVEVVRIVDRLMALIDIQASRLFNGPMNANRYDRIRGFLELIFGVWTYSLYGHPTVKPQIVNTSLLNHRVRERFEQLIQLL